MKKRKNNGGKRNKCSELEELAEGGLGRNYTRERRKLAHRAAVVVRFSFSLQHFRICFQVQYVPEDTQFAVV